MGWRHLAGLLLLLVAGGCSTLGYYAGAAGGQLELWRAARPVAALLADPATDPQLAGRLRLARALLDFADAELGLPAGGSYREYAALGREFVAWNVFAAPEFDLEPERWCYPLVGCLAYRGHFDPAAAARDADRLRARGYDVHVGGVAAYSTLGWFDDPLLDTFLFRREDRLAELLFHELAHRRLFVPGDTLFNESFASAVAAAGVQRWLARHDADGELRALHAAEEARWQELLALLSALRQRLATLYASSADVATLRPAKAALLAQAQADYAVLRAGWGDAAGFDAFLAGGLNNAKLNAIGLYHRLVPAFTRLLGRHGGELEPFYAEVERLAGLPAAERRRRLEALAAEGGASR